MTHPYRLPAPRIVTPCLPWREQLRAWLFYELGVIELAMIMRDVMQRNGKVSFEIGETQVCVSWLPFMAHVLSVGASINGAGQCQGADNRRSWVADDNE